MMLKAIICWLLSSSLFAQSYKVADFGAKCDGKTDDRSAIQRTIDKAFADGVGIVQLCRGTSLLKSVQAQEGRRYFLLDIPSNIGMVGYGEGVSFLKADGNMPDQTRILSSHCEDGSCTTSYDFFQDFTVDGNSENQPSLPSCSTTGIGNYTHACSMFGIDMTHTEHIKTFRVRVINIKGSPKAEGCAFNSYSSRYNDYIDNDCFQNGANAAGSCFGATDADWIEYKGNLAVGSKFWQGFSAYRSKNVHFGSGNRAFDNYQRGFNLESCDGCSIQGVHTERDADGIYCFQSKGATISGNSSRNNRQNDVVLNGCTQTIMNGNKADKQSLIHGATIAR